MITDEQRADNMGEATREKLQQFIARIERLEAEKAELETDIREVYSEAKTFGFDTKILRKTVTLRKIEASERAEQEALIDLYMSAVESEGGYAYKPQKQVEMRMIRLDKSIFRHMATAGETSLMVDGLLYVRVKDNVYQQT